MDVALNQNTEHNANIYKCIHKQNKTKKCEIQKSKTKQHNRSDANILAKKNKEYIIPYTL